MTRNSGIVTCHTVAELPTPSVPDARQQPCADCSELIWVAPSSLEVMAQREVDAVCIPCSLVRVANVPQSEDVTIQAAPGARLEFKEHLKHLWASLQRSSDHTPTND